MHGYVYADNKGMHSKKILPRFDRIKGKVGRYWHLAKRVNLGNRTVCHMN